MNGRDVIEVARNTIREAEASGHKAIDPKALLNLLNLLEQQVAASPPSPDAQQAALEAYKAKLSAWVAENEHVNAWSLEGFKQVIALGQAAIKSITLINGGAAVALLAFIGHLATSASAKLPMLPFTESLRFFVAGVFFAAATSATTYLTQLGYDGENDWHHKVGVTFHGLTILTGVTAFVFFFFGANEAYHAFTGHAS